MTREMEIDMAWAMHAVRVGSRFSPFLPGLAEAQNHRCCWCAWPLDAGDLGSKATIEHIIPTSMGGKDVLSNIAVACHACNTSRPSTSAELRRIAELFEVSSAELFGLFCSPSTEAGAA